MKRSPMDGFGLIESMITIAVLAILISVAVPSYQQMIQNGRTRTIAESFRAGINLARAEAMRRNMKVSLMVVSSECTPSSTATNWVVFLGGVCTAGNTLQRFDGNSAGTGVTVSSGVETLDFNGLGWFTTNNAGTTISFSNNLPDGQRRRLQLNVSSGGQTRLCDPDIASTGDPRYCGTP